MGCVTGIVRFILVLINVIVGLVWLAVAVLGALLAWGTPVIQQIITKYLQPLIDSLAKQNGGQVDISGLINLILEMGSTAGIVLFVAGLVLFILCCSGTFGACCDNTCLMLTFAISLSVLIAAQIVFIIIYFAKPSLFFDPARDAFTKTAQKYDGLKARNAESILWNLIQPWQNCCGSVGPSDFDTPPGTWNHTETYNGITIPVKYPVTCCKVDSSYAPINNTCPQVFNEYNSNINKPCFAQLKSQLTQYSDIVMYVFIGVVGGQAVLVLMAFLVACCKGPKNVL